MKNQAKEHENFPLRIIIIYTYFCCRYARPSDIVDYWDKLGFQDGAATLKVSVCTSFQSIEFKLSFHSSVCYLVTIPFSTVNALSLYRHVLGHCDKMILRNLLCDMVDVKYRMLFLSKFISEMIAIFDADIFLIFDTKVFHIEFMD